MPQSGYQPVGQGAAVKEKAQQALENAGKKFGGLWKLLFFVAACCVMSAGKLDFR